VHGPHTIDVLVSDRADASRSALEPDGHPRSECDARTAERGATPCGSASCGCMTQLRALFFDVDDTLYSTSAFAAAARRNAMQAMIDHGLAVDLDTLLAELAEVIAEFGSNYSNHYDQLLKRVPQSDIPAGSRALLVSAAMVAYHDTKFRHLHPFDDVATVLTALRERTELRLGVITEGLRVKQAEKIVRLGVLRWLDRDAVFISDEVGISKPNRKLFLRACQAVAVRPESVLYVGDHPRNDVAAAHAAGLRTVRFRSPGGKHSGQPDEVSPDYAITSLTELLPIVAAELGLSTL
jgi:putative hydrolase of the HAD superfamily